MYGTGRSGVAHPLPYEYVFWTGMEKARRTWRPVLEVASMLSDLDTLRKFILRVESWPADQRADLPHVVACLQSAHPSVYAELVEGLGSVPIPLALSYGESVLEIRAADRAWFRLLIMELYERATK
jgi:hypothetical protein